VPEKKHAQSTGRMTPARQARVKNGRKPTSQRGWVDIFMVCFETVGLKTG